MSKHQNVSTAKLSKSSWLKGLGLLLPFLAPTAATEIGVDICSCAPSTYEFTLDFSLFCPPVNITLGDAVAATSCMVSPFGDPDVTDLIPVAVQSIDILELNQDFQVIVQETIEGSFGDGDTFRYSSVAALPGEIIDPNDLPRAIQLNILGVNQFDDPIINVYLISFTNNCGKYPVLFEGQYAGWTRFHDLTPPLPDLCPIATPPTDSPSEPPSPVPSQSPTPGPTPGPTPIPDMSMSYSMSLDILSDLDWLDTLDEVKELGRVARPMKPRKQIRSS